MIRFLLVFPFLFILVSCSPTPAPKPVPTPIPAPPQSDVEEFLDQGGVQYMIVDGQYEWDGIRPIIE